ncbi:hypothetical protein [Neobacillus drentensis]
MRIGDYLSKEQKQQLNKLKKEHLSRRQLEELMGINRDTYKRVNGALRRK